MLKGATSFASVRANPVTAARTLLDRMRLSTGCFTAIDVTLMMRPQRRSFIPGSTARVNSTTLSRFCRTASCHASAECDSNGPAGGPPPFVTRMSMRPNLRVAASTIRATSAGLLTSPVIASTSPPCARIASAVPCNAASPRAHTTTRAPSRASSSATARPSPRLDAATSATLPPRPRSIATSCENSCRCRPASPVAAG